MRRTSTRCWGSTFGAVSIPPIVNEPMSSFPPGCPHRAQVESECRNLRGSVSECQIVIHGVRYTTDKMWERTIPSDNKHVIARTYMATPELAKAAVESSLRAHAEWSRTSFLDRAAVCLKAAHLITKKYRAQVLARTMLGQSKNPWQAEIDCVAEAADFLRFNVKYAAQMYNEQPVSPATANVWNTVEYRPLEGFVASITPFNFTAIGVNLAIAPVLMGNVTVWKPSPSAILSNYHMMQIFEEAGLPPGVINFLPCEPEVMEREVLGHQMLGGMVFTGSTKVFKQINRVISGNLDVYRNFPRISGETGGKNFHLLHPSCDINYAVASTVRSAFEYQGQKCSACSRVYVPKSRWAEFKEKLLAAHQKLAMGQPDDFRSFMCAVIDEAAFRKVSSYIDLAKTEGGQVLAGGTYDGTKGWFITPTVIVTENPLSTTMREEIFGPVLTVYVYDDKQWRETLRLVDETSPYGLTGSVFSDDRSALREAADALRYTCGNLYINDKSTGAV